MDVPRLQVLQEKRADSAMKGGIDLNASKLNLQRTGSGVDIQFDPVMIAQFRAGDFKRHSAGYHGHHPDY